MPAEASVSPYPASPVSRRRSACGPVRSLSAGIPTPPPPAARTRSGAHARCRKLPASRSGRDPPRRLYGPPAPRSRRPASPRRRLPPRSLLLGKRPGLIRARRRLRTSLKTNPPRGTTTPATAPVAAGAGAEGRRGTQKRGVSAFHRSGIGEAGCIKHPAREPPPSGRKRLQDQEELILRPCLPPGGRLLFAVGFIPMVMPTGE